MKHKNKTEYISNEVIKLLKKHQNVFFYQEENGTYILFQKYKLYKKSGLTELVNIFNDEINYFVNFKNATAYAILDYNNKIIPAKRLLELDKKIASSFVDLKIHINFFKKNGSEKTEIYRDKYLEDERKITEIQHEIDKYIILADMCHTKGFKNDFK